MSTSPSYVCSISTDEQWNVKVSHAAAAVGLRLKCFGSVADFIRDCSVEEEFACMFVQCDSSVHDWDSLEKMMLQQGITIPTIVVVDEQSGNQPHDAIKHLAHLVAINSMGQGEIIDTIRQSRNLKKTIDHQVDVRRYYQLMEALSQRERAIADMVVEGVPNKQMATKLSLSIKTIERVRQSVYKKLNVRSTAEMTRAVILGDLHDVVFHSPKMRPEKQGFAISR